MIYSNKSQLEKNLDRSKLDKHQVWVAQYWNANLTHDKEEFNHVGNYGNTSYCGEYDFWQYSSSCKIDGISGNVDVNWWYQSGTKK